MCGTDHHSLYPSGARLGQGGAARVSASISEDILRKCGTLKHRKSTVMPNDYRVHVDDALSY